MHPRTVALFLAAASMAGASTAQAYNTGPEQDLAPAADRWRLGVLLAEGGSPEGAADFLAGGEGGEGGEMGEGGEAGEGGEMGEMSEMGEDGEAGEGGEMGEMGEMSEMGEGGEAGEGGETGGKKRSGWWRLW